MMARHTFFTIILTLILSIAASAAHADDTRIEGNWVFKAWTGDGCNFTGTASIGQSTSEETGYTCELTARQTCESLEWIVRQTCTAKRSGNRLSITSRIVEFLSEPSGTYLPDNFLLTIDTPKRMFGALHSYGVYKAEWIRNEDNVS